MRRQHASREGIIPLELNTSVESEGENPEAQLLPNYKAESQVAAGRTQALITAERERKENPNQQLWMKVLFPDDGTEKQQLQG